MLVLPHDLAELYGNKLTHGKVSESYWNYYRKWLSYYLDFCQKYGFSPTGAKSISPFLEKLGSKHQSPTYHEIDGHDHHLPPVCRKTRRLGSFLRGVRGVASETDGVAPHPIS